MSNAASYPPCVPVDFKQILELAYCVLVVRYLSVMSAVREALIERAYR
jgi:hypothetical protein